MESARKKLTVTLIGLGSIGSGMARNLAAAPDIDVIVHNRTPGRYAAMRDLDVTIDTELMSAVTDRDIVMLSLTDDGAVTSTVAAIAANLRPGSTVVDTTTTSAATSQQLAQKLADREVGFVDAPVTGGAEAAQSGSLTLLCGAEPEVLDAARPALEAVSSRVVHVGGTGQGQVAKAVNQIMLAGCLLGVAEGVHLARTAGLDAGRLMADLRDGAARSWVLSDRSQYMVDGDFEPRGRIALHLKDLRIALAMAESLGVRLPLTDLVADTEQTVVDRGLGDGDVTVIIRAVEEPDP